MLSRVRTHCARVENLYALWSAGSMPEKKPLGVGGWVLVLCGLSACVRLKQPETCTKSSKTVQKMVLYARERFSDRFEQVSAIFERRLALPVFSALKMGGF